LETRRLEAEVVLERGRTAVRCPGDTTCRQLDNRNDATGAHAGLRRALTPKTCPTKLYLAATNVRTGKIKVFDNSKIGVEAVLASACLPFIFQAVEIDGEAHWDSGYMSNPQIFPLIYGCNSRDVVIVHINPLRREKLPTTATEIMNRINEISFNCSLMREMRAIVVTKLIDDGKILDNSMKRMLIHGIEAADVMAELGALNKLNADWDNLNHLMKVGRERTDAWLQQNFGRLGEESTVDIREEYL
jgi:NTE family protein